MDIYFPKKEFENSLRDSIQFPAIVDTKQITCLISREALQDNYSNTSDILVTFKNNRSNIESKAENLIYQRRYEPDGVILIRTADY